MQEQETCLEHLDIGYEEGMGMAGLRINLGVGHQGESSCLRLRRRF